MCTLYLPCIVIGSLFFFNDTATTEIYTLSLHDALPICWTDDTNDNTEQEEKLIALGLMDVENELRKNNKLVADLKKEQREQYENTNNELQERIAFEIQNLKNQKERDMEDLAYKIAQQLQNNSDDIYQKYIESSKTTFESLRVDIQREINKNTANLSMLSDQNKKYDRAVTVLKYNNQNQDKKELIFNIAMAVGLVLVSISVLIFAFLFFSTLSGFGLKQIMSLTILKYQAPTWQMALAYVFKVFLALLFYFGGLILILSPILIYQKFLKFISTKYFGFGGKLKNFFLRN